MKQSFSKLVLVLFISSPSFGIDSSYGGGGNPNSSPLLTAKPSRPFRVGFLKLDTLRDEQKSMANASYSGFSHASGLLIGQTSEGWITGFSLRTSKPKWWLPIPEALTAPPGIFGSWSILALRDGTVMKVEILTGKVIWTTKLLSFVSRSFKLSNSSLVGVTANQLVYSIDFQTGKTRWLHDGGHPEGLNIRQTGALSIQGDQVLVGLHNGEILALDLFVGSLLWQYNPDFSNARFRGVIGDLASVKNKLFFARVDGVFGALELKGNSEPQVSWIKHTTSITDMSYRDGRIFLGTLTGQLSAHSTKDGEKLWSFSSLAGINRLYTGEKNIFSAGINGHIHAFSSADGSLLWSDRVGGKIVSKPVLVDRDIYFSTGNRVLYGYRIDHASPFANIAKD